MLIDTHYGVPTTVRLPGSDNQLVITDVSAELSTRQGEPVDPAVRARAAALAAKASPATNARRGIYLCHNFCEMGAITFASVSFNPAMSSQKGWEGKRRPRLTGRRRVFSVPDRGPTEAR